jgi:hypothetical protein
MVVSAAALVSRPRRLYVVFRLFQAAGSRQAFRRHLNTFPLAPTRDCEY